MEKDVIRERIAKTIAETVAASPREIALLLEKPRDSRFGDLSLPCFHLAKGSKRALPEFTRELASRLPPIEGIDDVSAVGPFLNFRFAREAIYKDALAPDGDPAALGSENETVLIEYSSPNIAKPFHVGHLRATLIGNCLDRLYRRAGYRVVSINHLGDWGTQFGFVWAGCQLWGKPERPSVGSLVELYRRATALKEKEEAEEKRHESPASSSPRVTDMAREFFLALERREPEAMAFWQWCLEISMKYLKDTYHRLEIDFDHYIGESFYADMLDDTLADLRKRGLLRESQGALGVDLGAELGFARVATPDGRSLYLTRDLAAAKYRAERFSFSQALYVVGAPQALHFRQLKAILERAGYHFAQDIHHIHFGHVLGMKTRGKGGFIELNEFLDEAEERAREAYRTQVTKRPEGLDETEVARRVAIAAIVFGTLGKTRGKDVVFDWKHALEFQGDSGPYLLYAYARLSGIREKASAGGISPVSNADPALLPEDSAYQLALTISELPEIIARTTRENEPCVLANFLLELAKGISAAYLELKVVGADPNVGAARLALFEAAQRALGEGLRLLGITPVERM